MQVGFNTIYPLTLYKLVFIPDCCKNNYLIGNVKIEMTKGVTTKHILEKKDKFGEIELQEMCFYLENKFQVPMMMFMMT